MIIIKRLDDKYNTKLQFYQAELGIFTLHCSVYFFCKPFIPSEVDRKILTQYSKILKTSTAYNALVKNQNQAYFLRDKKTYSIAAKSQVDLFWEARRGLLVHWNI